MSDLKIQGEVQLSAEGAESALDRVGDKAERMASRLQTEAGKAGKAVDSIGSGAANSADQFTRAEGRIADSIKRATTNLEQLGKTASQKLELKINDRGLDASKFEPLLAKLRELEAAQSRVGVSAAQTAAAMRGVPAQFTDIVTSLQSGQQPMTVLLQQGGQLKDMFGGAGNAARALSGYVVGLINPFTVAAGAAVALAVAYKQGADEAQAFNRSIILTGNAAGASANQLQGIASSVSAATGATKGAVADALAQIVDTGRVSSGSLNSVASAAINMERVTGKAISDTVKEFAELGKSPVEASVKLNDQYNYLTASIYQQIKALEDQGRAADAAALAQKTYADAMSERAGKIKESLGLLETGWKAVADGAKLAWDKMLNVGRETTLEDKIANQVKYLQDLRGGFFAVDTTKAEQYLTQLQIQLEKTKRLAAEEAERGRVQKEGIAAVDAVGKANEKALTKQEQMNKALSDYRSNIDKIKAADPNSALLDPAKIAKAESAIREQFKDTKAIAAAKQEIKELADLLAKINGKDNGLDATYWKDIETLHKAYSAGKLTLDQYRESVGKLTKEQKFNVDADKEALAGIKARSEFMGKMVADENKRFEALTKGNEKLSDEIAMLGMNKQQQAEYSAAKLESAAASDLATASAIDYAIAEGQFADVLPEIVAGYEALAAAKRASADSLSEQANLTRQKAAREVAVDQAKASAKAWENFARDIEQSLTDSLYRAFESGQSFGEAFANSLKNTFKSMVLKVAVQAVIGTSGNLLNAGLNALVGTSGSNGGAGNNYLGTANNASSLYNLWGAGSALAGGTVGASSASLLYANAVGAVGGDSLGALIAANGGWSAVPVGTTAASGAAAGSAGASSTASVAASAWPLAVIAGMYMSGKLYDSGYKFDNESFKADDPKSWSMAAQAGMYNEANIVGKLFGQDHFGDSKFFQVATGANLSLYVDRAIQKFLGIRGGAPKAEGWSNQTIQADGTTVNAAGAEQFGSNFGASHGSSAETVSAVNSLLAPMAMYISDAAKSLGASAEGLSVVLGFNTDPGGDAPDNITGGVTGRDGKLLYSHIYDADRGSAQKEMIAELSRITLAALQSLDISSIANDYLDSLDIASMTADQTAVALQMLQTFKATGQAMEDLHISAEGLTTGLVNAFGGIQGLQGALSTYYDNYYTAEEKRARIVDQITTALNAAGANLSDATVAAASRADFRSWIEGIDQTTDAGKALFTAALQASSAFASITAAVENATDSLLAQKQALAAQASAGTDSAFAALQRSIGAEKTAAQAALDAANERVTAISAVFDVLKTNIAEINASVSGTNGRQVDQANAFISQSLTTAQRTGYLPDSEALAQAIGTVRGAQTADAYASSLDYQRAQLQLAGKLQAIEDIAGPQLSAAERAAKAAEDQLQLLQTELDLAQQQVDAIRGVDTSVLAVQAAIGNLAAAIAAEKAAAAAVDAAKTEATTGTSAAADTSMAGQVADLYENMLGRQADLAGQSYWATAAAAAGSVSAILDAFRAAAINAGEVPKFAAGGYYGGGLALVGEQGPEIINFRNPGQVYTAGQTAGMFSGGGDTAKEIAELRAEQRAQAAALAGFMARLTNTVERWDTEGLPETAL